MEQATLAIAVASLVVSVIALVTAAYQYALAESQTGLASRQTELAQAQHQFTLEQMAVPTINSIGTDRASASVRSASPTRGSRQR